jgi:hypothetical protein
VLQQLHVRLVGVRGFSAPKIITSSFSVSVSAGPLITLPCVLFILKEKQSVENGCRIIIDETEC